METHRYDKMELIGTHVSNIRITLTFLVYWDFFQNCFNHLSRIALLKFGNKKLNKSMFSFFVSRQTKHVNVDLKVVRWF